MQTENFVKIDNLVTFEVDEYQERCDTDTDN